MTTTIRVHVDGPLFNGKFQREVNEFADKVVEEISNQTFAEVMGNLNTSIRHPTPYYETQINIHTEDPRHKVVNDRGIIYGPWLEGVGSRNFPVTRFKGYASFRRAVQQVGAQAKERCERILEPYLMRMRGEG
jgi:hypothetical protein